MSSCFGSLVVIFLLFIEFHTASCDTFYIVSTPSSHCPGEFSGVPCLTLQQYASNPSQRQNITFLVEPGTYNLSTILTVSNGYNFTMSSTNATVVCTSSTAQLLFDTIENVYISGITFQQCRNRYGVVQMSSIMRANILNSHFVDNGYIFNLYPCLYVITSTVSISECTFQYNQGYWGGVIYARSSQISISGSSFDYNSAFWGGGIYSVSSTIAVENTIFNKNTATNHGGAIYKTGSNEVLTIHQSYYISNRASMFGGAVYVEGRNSSVGVTGGSFLNNTANSFGGALYVVGTNSSISVTGSSFINNTAVGEGGGAIYSNGRYANVTLSSSTFTNNSASYCSALDIDNYNHFSINLTTSVFTYNTATGQTIGGGVACIRNASISILNSVFKHNFANLHAGVFYIDESVTTVDGGLFINNSAAVDGVVFYTYVHASDYII